LNINSDALFIPRSWLNIEGRREKALLQTPGCTRPKTSILVAKSSILTAFSVPGEAER